MIDDPDNLAAETIRFFSKLPPQWWDTWELQAQYFDEQGVWIADEKDPSLEDVLGQSTSIVQPRTH